MGHRYAFSCGNCGYRPNPVSGRDDVGMAIVVTTILCYQCKKLFDVVTHRMDTHMDVPIRCPKNASHRWRRWMAPDACPSCGEPEMDNLGLAAFWD